MGEALAALARSPLVWILAFVIVQRLGELELARANTRRLLACGGREVGRRHYPLFILLHASWLVALVWSILNALLLRHRIAVESAALAPREALSPRL